MSFRGHFDDSRNGKTLSHAGDNDGPLDQEALDGEEAEHEADLHFRGKIRSKSGATGAAQNRLDDQGVAVKTAIALTGAWARQLDDLQPQKANLFGDFAQSVGTGVANWVRGFMPGGGGPSPHA